MRQKKKSRRQNVAARQNKKRGIAPFFYGIDNRVYILSATILAQYFFYLLNCHVVRNCKLINSKIDFVVDLIVVYDNIQTSVGVPLTGCSSPL